MNRNELWWVAALVLLPSPVLAQMGPSLGVELGYSRADFIGADASGVEHREGVVAGAWFRLPLGSGIAVQPGLVMASRGGAVAVPSSSGTTRLEVDLVYLDLPVLLRARLPGVAGANLVVLGGGAPSVSIGCNLEVQQAGVQRTRQPCDETAGTSFRVWDLALVAGVGIAIPVERSELSIEAKLVRGLRSVREDSDLRNRTYSVSVSVPF